MAKHTRKSTKKAEKVELPNELKEKPENTDTEEEEAEKTPDAETSEAKHVDAVRSMNLFEKMLYVRASVENLVKGNSGEGIRYKYVSSSDVLSAIRDAMNLYGVMLIPVILKQAVREQSLQGRNGTRREVFTELDMEYHWINAHNPSDKMVVKWAGQGTDDFEKGLGKALTYSEKYLMLKTFNIPTNDADPDAIQDKEAGLPTKGPSKQNTPQKAQKQPQSSNQVTQQNVSRETSQTVEVDIGEVGRKIVEDLNTVNFLKFMITKKWLNEEQKLTDLKNEQLERLGRNWNTIMGKFKDFEQSIKEQK